MLWFFVNNATAQEGANFSEAELMQYRSPVGLGPSSNT